MNERQPRRRSELIRRKLNQESRSAIQQAARKVVEPPAEQTRARQTLGRLAANFPGESGSAVKRRLRPGWRLLSFTLVGIFSFLIFNAWTSPEYKVTAVQINGLQRIDQEELLKQINLTGTHIFALKPEEIAHQIAARYPELRNVKVRLSLPAKIAIVVDERQPMFIWQMKDRLLWIDTEGYLIPARGEAPEMLVIAADSLPAYELDKTLDEIEGIKAVQDKSINKPGVSELAFYSQAKHMNLTLLSGVLQLNAWMPKEPILLYQKQRGLGWKDTRGWDVFMGQKLENINDKMVMYETIVRDLEGQEINPSLVSVEFLHAPYYKVDK